MSHSRFQRFSIATAIAAWLLPVFVQDAAISAERNSVGIAKPRQPNPIPDDTCYWVTSSGQRMSLGQQLCGDTPLPKATPAGSKTAPASSEGIIRVKIKRRIASTPVIEVAFNNRPYDMILDTGASSTLITREMAQALKVKPVRTVRAGIADGSTVQFPVGYVESIAVNGLSAKNLPVAIASQMDVGLLGHDFFGKYDIKIKKDTIEFYPR